MTIKTPRKLYVISFSIQCNLLIVVKLSSNFHKIFNPTSLISRKYSKYFFWIQLIWQRTFSNCYVTSKKITLQHFNDLTVFYDSYASIKTSFEWNFLNILSLLLISHFKINWITTLPPFYIMKNSKYHKISQNHSVLFIYVDENISHFFCC